MEKTYRTRQGGGGMPCLKLNVAKVKLRQVEPPWEKNRRIIAAEPRRAGNNSRVHMGMFYKSVPGLIGWPDARGRNKRPSRKTSMGDRKWSPQLAWRSQSYRAVPVRGPGGYPRKGSPQECRARESPRIDLQGWLQCRLEPSRTQKYLDPDTTNG